MLRIVSHSEAETMNLAVRLAHFLSAGDIVCLFGTLGAGKTILVKGIAKGLGISKNEVISPSFILIREYPPGKRSKPKIPLYHFDLFRLKNPKDILRLGYEEYFYAQGICAIEWAERMIGFLPSEFLKIELKIKNKTKRIINFIAHGQRYRKILPSFGNTIREKRP